MKTKRNNIFCRIGRYGLLPAAVFLFQAASAAEFADFAQGTPHSPDTPQNGVRIVNLWAAWCAPCREEMPDLDAFARAHGKKVQVVGIAFDTPENIGKFLQKTPVAYDIWYYTGSDSAAAMRALGNQAGALPYTLAENPRCGFRRSFYGKVSREELEKVFQAASACKK